MYKKLAIELVFMVITLTAIVLIFRFAGPKSIEDQMKQIRIDDAKRLYGAAWKEALKLDDE